MRCKSCNRTYHHCTSCDYDKYNSAGYCSADCFMDSEEWKTFAPKVQDFYDSLTKDQQLELWCLWDNGIFIDDKYEFHIDMVIEDPRTSDD